MANARHSAQLTSKFNITYSRLFQGQNPLQISPNEPDPDRFYSNLLILDVNREFLEGELDRIAKEACLGPLKVIYVSLCVSVSF